jgi:hypothetical protein
MRIDFKVLLPMSVRGVNKSRLLIDNGHIEMKTCIPLVNLQFILELLEGQILTHRKIRNISSDTCCLERDAVLISAAISASCIAAVSGYPYLALLLRPNSEAKEKAHPRAPDESEALLRFFLGGFGLSFSFCEISFRKEVIMS